MNWWFILSCIKNQKSIVWNIMLFWVFLILYSLFLASSPGSNPERGDLPLDFGKFSPFLLFFSGTFSNFGSFVSPDKIFLPHPHSPIFFFFFWGGGSYIWKCIFSGNFEVFQEIRLHKGLLIIFRNVQNLLTHDILLITLSNKL